VTTMRSNHLEAWREAGLVEGPPLLQPPRELLGRAEIHVHLLPPSFPLSRLDLWSRILSVTVGEVQRWCGSGGRCLVEVKGSEVGGGIRARDTAASFGRWAWAAAGRGAGGLAAAGFLCCQVCAVHGGTPYALVDSTLSTELPCAAPLWPARSWARAGAAACFGHTFFLCLILGRSERRGHNKNW
jgi:hypothetical protein